MLKKLLKYDFKYMTRILVYMYAISILLASVTRLVCLGNNIQIINILGKILQGFTFSAIANVLVNTFVHIIATFIKNFYKDESYLTHTLPVTKTQLLTSKMLASLLVTICGVLVCFLSLFIMFYSPEFMAGIKSLIQITVANFSMSAGVFVAVLTSLLFLQTCLIIAMAFTAIIKANTYNDRRILYGLIWLFIYYTIFNFINLGLSVLVCAVSGNLAGLFAEQVSQGALICTIITICVSFLVETIVLCFYCNSIFNKGVNVD